MLKEFLEVFSKIIEMVPDRSVTDPDNEFVKKTIELYTGLSEREKDSLLQIVKSFSENGFEYRAYFDLYCLHNFKDARFAEDLLDILISEDMDCSRRYNYMFVLGRELFLAHIRCDYIKRLTIEEMIVKEIRNKSELFPDYMPYEKRNKGLVVIIINPFLGIYHSPSLASVSLGYYLEQLGYNVSYVSLNDNDILRKNSTDDYISYIRNSLYNGITRFEYSFFDRTISGLHFDLRSEVIADDINALAVHISQIAPEFVIAVEGGNVLADVCTLFTDVVCMNVVNDLPVTMSKITMRYFAGELSNDYIYAEEYGKIIIDAVFQNAFQPFNRGEEKTRLPEDCFLICVMGNRLDDELGGEMVERIREIVREIPRVNFVFIGNCPKTIERLADIKDRCSFLGYVERCEDTVAECSMFLNPPRQGGGGGGYMAVKHSVPVYTLKECDVASCVGDDFSHDSYEELLPFVKRCVEEEDYYGSMRKKAKEAYLSIFGENSLENIKAFCATLTGYIDGKDEKR